jgi:hypothetical protein
MAGGAYLSRDVRGGLDDFGQAVSQEPVVGSGEEQGLPMAVGGDSVAVAVRDAFDECVVPQTSSRARESSPADGRATAASTSWATPMSRAANGPLAPTGRTPASCSRLSIASPRWPSDGCSAPTRVRSTRRTCRVTSTSTSSPSTDVGLAAEAWSSTGCLSSPSHTHRCAIATWSPTRSRSGRRPHHQDDGAIPRPWTGHERLGHGERPDLHKSGQMNTPEGASVRSLHSVSDSAQAHQA